MFKKLLQFLKGGSVRSATPKSYLYDYVEDVWAKDPEVARGKNPFDQNARTLRRQNLKRNKPYSPVPGMRHGGASEASRKAITGASGKLRTLCTGRMGCACPICLGGGVDGGFKSLWQGIKNAWEAGQWLGLKGVYHGSNAASKLSQGTDSAIGATSYVIQRTLEGMANNPGLTKTIAGAALGLYGYSGEGTFYEKLERGATYATLGAAATSRRFWGDMRQTGAHYAGRVGAWMGSDAPMPIKGPWSPLRMAITAGAVYGGLNEDHNILEGALLGAGLRGAFKAGGTTDKWMSARRGLAIGATYGAWTSDENRLAGAALGGVVGMGLGGLAHGLRYGPKTRQAVIGGGISTAIIGGASYGAYNTIQQGGANYDLGADGALTLGLHSLRHG